MPNQVTNYKCPACTAPLHYAGSSGKLECDYCGSSYDVEEIEALYRKKEEKAEKAFHEAEENREDWDASGMSSDWGAEGAGMKAYNCPSCGAQLICDESTAATSCPYCGNPTVVPGNFAGTLKPDFILPFKLDPESAKETLKKHYKGKRLLPKEFTEENKINEIQGVYVPFWLFDGRADADVRFAATQVSSYRSGDYEVTETRHYDVDRAGTVSFEKIPVDASSKMPDEYMDAIEPYDYGELKPFSNAYLPGYVADKYDVSSKESAQRADERSTNTAIAAMRSDVQGYDTCTMLHNEVTLHRGKVHYALLPVYLLHTRWQEKDYLFAMNGQTGKMVSKLPVSKAKWWAWFAGITVPLTLVLGTIIQFLM